MDKKILFGIVTVMLLASVGMVFAIKPNGPSAYNGLNHPGEASQLYLYEKDSSWNPVPGGAWGKMTFNCQGSFVFNGHGLVAETGYTLIRYTDSWPGSPVCLGSEIANTGGNVHIAGDMLNGGPKVWLVLTSDVNCGNAMTGWQPEQYLFEYNLICPQPVTTCQEACEGWDTGTCIGESEGCGGQILNDQYECSTGQVCCCENVS